MVGPGRALAQAVQPRGVEGGDDPADRLVITAEVAGDLGRALAPRTGEHDLAAPENERVGRAQAGRERLALGVLKRTHVHRCSHTT